MKRTARKKETICLCPYCLEELRSRGEKVRTDGITFPDAPVFCDWCGDETEEHYNCEL